MTGSGPQSVQIGGEDYATKPGLNIEALTRFLRDIDYQPSWRARADVDADYYDSNQYDSKTLQEMEERGIPPIVVNLIAPTVNLILGMEAKVRQDWVVRSDDETKVDFAEALSKELQKAERMTRADRACSEAYAGQVKTGLHWVHVRRQRLNPFGPKYCVEPVHRREIWWDWNDLTPDLSLARWLVRRKFYDYDTIKAMFPRFKELVENIADGWSMFESRELTEHGISLYQDWLTERDFEFDIDTWRNEDRKQAMMYEVWYRVLRRAYVLKLPDDRVFEFDRANPVHVAAVSQGHGELAAAVIPKMRLSWWLGPHRLTDVPSPLPHEGFPYVPFFGYREDRTGVPYGQIRAMRPLQDEVNARRARMLWQLSSRRIIGDDDAVKDKRAVEAEIARPDAAIWLNPERRNRNSGVEAALKIEDHQGLNAQQMSAYEDAKGTLQDVANTFKEQLGKADASQSGIAISQLIEQGTTALAELNENYTTSRKIVGEQLLSLVKEDIGKKERKITFIAGGSGRRKEVILNERRYDEENNVTYRNNDVAMTKSYVALDAVPTSASFRQHQFRELSNIVKQLPPELQAPMLDMVVEASDAPYKDEIVRRIRETLGISDMDPENMSDQEREAFEEKAKAEELIKAMEDALLQLQVEREDLENRKLDAETEKIEAETEKTEAETEKIEAEAAAPEPDMASEARIPGTRNLPPAEAQV